MQQQEYIPHYKVSQWTHDQCYEQWDISDEVRLDRCHSIKQAEVIHKVEAQCTPNVSKLTFNENMDYHVATRANSGDRIMYAVNSQQCSFSYSLQSNTITTKINSEDKDAYHIV